MPVLFVEKIKFFIQHGFLGTIPQMNLSCYAGSVMQKSLLEMLENRITEVEWFGHQHGLYVEPHLYPQGLFHVQNDPVECYHLRGYVEEIRQDLARLKQLSLPLLKIRAAEQLQQKVNVLINTFRSQTMRTLPKNAANPFRGEVNLETGNVYQYLAEKNQPPSHTRLKVLLKKQLSDKEKLKLSMQEKQRQLKSTNDTKDRGHLQTAILELSKQIGGLEQRITRITEELARS